MPFDFKPADYLPAVIIGIVVGGSVIVAGLRALWLYNPPRWLRFLLLASSAIGVGAALLGTLISHAPVWLFPLGGVIAVFPLTGWLVVRSIAYTGPPAGLQR